MTWMSLIRKHNRVPPASRTLLFTAVVLLAGCASNSEMPEQKVDKNAFYEGKPTVAFAGLQVAQTAEEGIKLGDAALARGTTDEALFHYVRTLELDSKSAQAYYRIGQIHSRRGNTEQASLALRSALAQDDEHIGALESLGVLQLKQNRYVQAKSYLQKAVDLDRARFPESAMVHSDNASPAEAYNGLGVIEDLNGRMGKAQQLYRTALSIRPGAPDILNNLGYSYYLESRWPEAEAQFRQALENDGQFAQAWRNLGLVYARQGRYLSALHAFERIMDSAKAHNDIGYICMLDGQYDLAEHYFEQALTLSPMFYKKAKENLTQLRRLKESSTQAVMR